MTAIRIEYWDNWKIAREKINAIIDEVNASIPSIWPNGNWFIGGVDTWLYAIWLKLQSDDNLIQQNANEEWYVDLQFDNNLTTTSVFPIWVTVGNVRQQDWRIASWLMLNQRTKTSYARLIYGDDWKLYFDWWLGVFKAVATSEEVSNQLQQLRSELHTVAFTGLSSDLNNDYWFSAVPLVTIEERENIPTTWWDDKEYLIYETKAK